MATWRSGYAAVCKTVYPGSIPGVASKEINHLRPGPGPAGPTSHYIATGLIATGFGLLGTTSQVLIPQWLYRPGSAN
jgi:hypothetical protein